MNHEPLKNKTYPFIELLKDYEELVIAKQDKFVYEGHVKSAVEGLKQELTSFMEKNPALETWVYRRVMKMIDKWFEDVIK